MGSIKSRHVGNEYDAYRDTTDYNQQDDINFFEQNMIDRNVE